ncbi:MAG: alpha/beta hydrolase, partial [Spirochaetales bacterium]|nr:alpha/beta hydrolase [Candidatus Physcosoma equi]
YPGHEAMIALLLVLLLLCLLVVISSYVVYRMAFHSPNKTQNDSYKKVGGEQYDEFREETVAMIKALDEKPCEWVSVTSFDGLKLWGRFYFGKESAPTVICFHGYRGTDLRDFSGGASLLFDKDWNVLLIEERGCSRSEGHAIPFGIREKKDLFSWVDYLNRRFGEEKALYLMGISMGAATVIMASGMDTPRNLRGIVADCPYSSPYDIIRKVAVTDMNLPSFFAMPLVCLGGRLFAHIDLKKAESAAECVKRTKVPVLILHGLADRFVPDYMSEEIYLSNPKMVQRETFPRAGHGLSFMVDRKRYTQVVNEFLDRTLL